MGPGTAELGVPLGWLVALTVLVGSRIEAKPLPKPLAFTPDPVRDCAPAGSSKFTRLAVIDPNPMEQPATFDVIIAAGAPGALGWFSATPRNGF